MEEITMRNRSWRLISPLWLCLLAVGFCRPAAASLLEFNTTDMTIREDFVIQVVTFRGVPFSVHEEGGIARFYFQGDLIFNPDDTIIATGKRPLSLVSANNVFLPNGATFDASWYYGAGGAPAATGAGGGGGGATFLFVK